MLRPGSAIPFELLSSLLSVLASPSTTFTTAAAADNVAPTVVMVTPADGTTDVSRTAPISLTFSESLRTIFVKITDTARAGNTFLVVRRGHVIGAERPPASVTLYVATFSQVAVDRDAGIKNETLAAPAILLRWHVFEILQNAALQVVHIVESKLEHQRSRFLATNTTRAKHREGFVA